ncbi:MAG: 4Fe-4S binding protein [Candidatus Tectomicrobia bacterium]|uniref:4Fe-4S binding protein n=1 Tax=Tectimicrobiota bacterium TaxID=2528274 RepID=A0A932FXR3_UNCTE|nr:4Fe-4S binding protein [Candidatus Tectomicrobia bacterium]
MARTDQERDQGRPEALSWEREASDLMKRVPFFVRPFARGKVEEWVRSEGRTRVTTEDVRRCRARFLKEVDRQEPPPGGSGMASPPERAGEEVPELYQVTPCRGKGLGCPFARVETQDLTHLLEERLQASGITAFLLQRTDGLLLPHHRFKVALAGCPNGCSQPQIKDFGLIAQSVPGRGEGTCTRCGLCLEACQERAIILEEEGPVIHQERCVNCGLCAQACPQRAIVTQQEGYRILVGGRLGRHPHLGEELLPLASVEEVLEALERCLNAFMELAEPRERFSDFIVRHSRGQGTVKNLVNLSLPAAL